MDFNNLTREDMEKLEKRYGDLFWKAYKEQVFNELERRENIEKLMETYDRKEKPYTRLLEESQKKAEEKERKMIEAIENVIDWARDTEEQRNRELLGERGKYGNLLDNYIK